MRDQQIRVCRNACGEHGVEARTASFTLTAALQIQYTTARGRRRYRLRRLWRRPDGRLLRGMSGNLFMVTQVALRSRFFEDLGRGRRIIAFDHRGTGHSDRDAIDLSLEPRLLHLRAVMDAMGERVDVVALGASVPAAVAFAAHYPARVRRLALYGTPGGAHL